ncbi:hypothetical protein [uncultured Ruminococcus sp.]|jgi:hypothetical protein|uniref:hypothetical protein n=1 Tax=uncultured Ruminococcus sp. TaxID=165186 RepID=UPI000AE6C34F|nr:hypothetical protein [uncultured Ruminococcus sp.]
MPAFLSGAGFLDSIARHLLQSCSKIIDFSTDYDCFYFTIFHESCQGFLYLFPAKGTKESTEFRQKNCCADFHSAAEKMSFSMVLSYFQKI